MLSFLIISLIWSVTSIYGIGHCQSLTSRNQSWEAEAAPAAAPAGLTFWERKYMLYFGICLVGWLVCWLYINNEPKKLWREKIAWDSRTNRFHSISLFQLNFVHVMCLPGAVNTAEVEKVGAELRALKEKLKQEAQGNEMHCRHSFWPNHFVFWVSIYLYVIRL